jgi:methionine-rich copper-binding protein CopC
VNFFASGPLFPVRPLGNPSPPEPILVETAMKKILAALAVTTLLCSSHAALAQTQPQGSPNVKESINFFMHYFNEAVVQGIQIQELLKSNAIDGKDVIFYTDLANRLEKTLGLALNLRDLYYLYGKTTYCFTKDERKYLLDRIANISEMLTQITSSDFDINISGNEKDIRARENEAIAKFRGRVERLQAFIETSLHIFK